jgi:hypothetical protein
MALVLHDTNFRPHDAPFLLALSTYPTKVGRVVLCLVFSTPWKCEVGQLARSSQS